MDSNIGKKFEDRFRKDYKECFPGTFIYRLPDQQSGYAGGGSQNPCDFICYPGSLILMAECKAHKGASIPFSAIPQYERMLEYKSLKSTHAGVVVWFYEKDIVIWVSIEEMEKMVLDGEKSIGLRMLKPKKDSEKAYNIITIPSVKLRAFMESDYNYLVKCLEVKNG